MTAPHPVRAAARTLPGICTAAAVLMLALAAVAPAQCPHQGIKPVESKTRLGPIQKCGTSITLQLNGVSIQQPVNGCPMWAIYEPPHDKPTPKDNHYTKPGNAVPIVMFTMKCTDSWLFGFIPIPIGSYCELKGQSNIGTIQNYLEFPCSTGDGGGVSGGTQG